MLASINPLVERARRSRYWITATAYVLGSIVGGAVTGLVAGGLGALLGAAVDLGGSPTGWIIASLSAVALACEVGRLPVPSNHRQVDEAWLEEYRGWVYGLGFGLQLGLGFATIVTTASVYLVFAIAVLSGSVVSGLVVGVTFGVVRSLPLLTMARVHDPSQLRRHLARFAAWAPRASSVTAVVVACTGIVVVVSMSGGGAAWPG